MAGKRFGRCPSLLPCRRTVKNELATNVVSQTVSQRLPNIGLTFRASIHRVNRGVTATRGVDVHVGLVMVYPRWTSIETYSI